VYKPAGYYRVDMYRSLSQGWLQYKPEDYNIKGWEQRVQEALFSAIKLCVEDKKRLPSAKEYLEMARHAIENPTR
jgi:hypothetical protein